MNRGKFNLTGSTESTFLMMRVAVSLSTGSLRTHLEATNQPKLRMPCANREELENSCPHWGFG
ncbi:MAG: hypothetical protein WCI29_13380, partial [Actinomycetes bacterium]